MWPIRPYKSTEIDIRFLSALEKTRRLWDDDKQFTDTVKKLRKGKDLKRAEFDKVQHYLREHCQHFQAGSL